MTLRSISPVQMLTVTADRSSRSAGDDEDDEEEAENTPVPAVVRVRLGSSVVGFWSRLPVPVVRSGT